MVYLQGKASLLDEAEILFQSISSPTVYDYSAMSKHDDGAIFHRHLLMNLVNAYGRNGRGLEAVNLYQQIPVKIRDPVIDVCVLNACSHAGLIDHAQSIFQQIQNKTEHIVGAMVSIIVNQ